MASTATRATRRPSTWRRCVHMARARITGVRSRRCVKPSKGLDVADARAITSRDNPLLVRLRKQASDPAAYRKLGQLWVEGDHLCSALIQRGGKPAQAVISEA